ncbi:MAG TPA: acyl-CoA dehydrogenase family protein [Syntrophomonadaceae bacterium]|nr:acyl-CoA dehydrogenase family protein [Syntrophomonadaceae bacterium]
MEEKMNFELTKEQQLIQKAAREFAQKAIMPNLQKLESQDKIPDDILEGIADLELFGMPFEEEYGGAGSGYDSYVLALEQIARVSSGVALVISVNILGLSAIKEFGTEEQKQRFMVPCCKGEQLASFAFTEAGTGSDPKQIVTTAVKEGNHYIINGTKRFISNANYPGPMVVFARDDESNEVSAFIVDKLCEGYSLSEPWAKAGMHGSRLLDVYLENVKVPKENLLGSLGQGFPVLLLGIAYGKVGVGASALGGILAAYEESINYAREKMHRDKSIAKFTSIQLKIADIVMKYEAARWLAYRIGHIANKGNANELMKEVAISKTFITETMVDVARIAMDIHGSYGLMKDYRILQIYNDAIIGPQIEGVNDVQKMIIAASVLR